MRIWRGLILAVCLALCLGAGPAGVGRGSGLFQTSTLPALMAGIYDGDLTFRDLARHGDFGLGTFKALDGEMIGLDGVFYQIKADGKVYPVSGDMTTPFAAVAFFKPDATYRLDRPMTYEQLLEYIAARLPGPNITYAIRVDGDFAAVKTRSVPRQAKPYPPLAAVVQRQAVFDLADVKGVIVGFRFPEYLAGVHVAGYHCHFITADRRAGGHLLGCQVKAATVAVAGLSDFHLRLPSSMEFLQMGVKAVSQQEVDKVEK